MFRRMCLSLVAVSAVLGGIGYGAGDAHAARTTTGVHTVYAPVIYRFTPFFGGVGGHVTIKGMDLSNATALTFNGVHAVIIKDTDKHIRTMVPPGATTGPIRVTTAGGTVGSAQSFTVTKPPARR